MRHVKVVVVLVAALSGAAPLLVEEAEQARSGEKFKASAAASAQSDVDLDPTNGRITPSTLDDTGAGRAGELRDDVSNPRIPYTLCYCTDQDYVTCKNVPERWEPVQAVYFTVDRGLAFQKQTVGLFQVKEPGKEPRVSIHVDDRYAWSPCGHVSGCKDAGMPKEMTGKIVGDRMVLVKDGGEVYIGAPYPIRLEQGRVCH